LFNGYMSALECIVGNTYRGRSSQMSRPSYEWRVIREQTGTNLKNGW